MKRIISALLLIFLVLMLSVSLFGCFSVYYIGWQKIRIPDIGSFRIPHEWIFTNKDDYYYITDKPINEDGYIVYFIGAVWEEGETEEPVFPDDIFDGEFKEKGMTIIYQNGSSLGQNEYIVDGVKNKIYYMSFKNTSDGDRFYFVTPSGFSDQSIIAKIVRSFDSE